MKKSAVILVSTLLACSMLVSCGNKTLPPSNSSNASSTISSVNSAVSDTSSVASTAQNSSYQSDAHGLGVPSFMEEPFSGDKYYIDGRLIDKVGEENLKAWINGEMKATPEKATLYAFLKHFNITDDEFRQFVKENNSNYHVDYILSNYDPNLAPKQ